MPKRLTNNVITGNDRKLGLYFYYSPHFDLNIIRKTTSLTGERVKTDAAFKGFRESGNRMKLASPIAAALYKLIPAGKKQFSLYRLLTGETIRLLKEGLDKDTITETLNRTHIQPLINGSALGVSEKEGIIFEKDFRERGLQSLTRLPEQKPRDNGRLSTRRSHTLPSHKGQMTESKNESEYLYKPETSSSQLSKNYIRKPVKSEAPSIAKKEKIPGLIYMGRLPECKKLKLWFRSDRFPGS